jgi:geranylgeranyl pyrophosphate synthase
VNAHQGISYTKTAMKKYVSEAIEIIDKLPDNPYKENVKELVNFIIDRNH